MPFVQDNPQLVTSTKYAVADFAYKAEAHKTLSEVKTIESAENGHTKALRDVVSSNLHFYWTTAEDFYLDVKPTNTVIIEKHFAQPQNRCTNRKGFQEIGKQTQQEKRRRHRY